MKKGVYTVLSYECVDEWRGRREGSMYVLIGGWVGVVCKCIYVYIL